MCGHTHGRDAHHPLGGYPCCREQHVAAVRCHRSCLIVCEALLSSARPYRKRMKCRWQRAEARSAGHQSAIGMHSLAMILRPQGSASRKKGIYLVLADSVCFPDRLQWPPSAVLCYDTVGCQYCCNGAAYLPGIAWRVAEQSIFRSSHKTPLGAYSRLISSAFRRKNLKSGRSVVLSCKCS